MNHLLLDLFLQDARPTLEGNTLRAARHADPMLVMEVSPPARFLVVLTAPPGPFCYLSPEDPLEGTGREVFVRVAGARIESAALVSGDRVIRLALDHAAGDITISMYGARSKVRVQSGTTIVESLEITESGRTLAGTSRRASSLPEIDADRLVTMPTDELARVSGVRPELLDAFGIGAGGDAGALARFRDELRRGTCEFFLGTRQRGAHAVPLPAGGIDTLGLGFRYGPFRRAGEACRVVGEVLAEEARGSVIDRLVAPVAKRHAQRVQLIGQLEVQLNRARRFDIGRSEANILAAYQSKVPPGASRVTLPNLYQQGETVTIELDPSMPVSEQIERRFKRAAKLERSCEALERRIAVLQAEVAVLSAVIERVSRATGLAEVETAVRPYRGAGGARRRTGPPQEGRTYRRYDLGPTWFALVGRSDRENDELTFKVARPNDIWMHAQHVAGSHLILKSDGAPGNPPESILEVAAAIAAFYSKSKHASVVPVIYTHRKYVRKFRGARPGEVTCDREKTIFARPGLPNPPDHNH